MAIASYTVREFAEYKDRNNYEGAQNKTVCLAYTM